MGRLQPFAMMLRMCLLGMLPLLMVDPCHSLLAQADAATLASADPELSRSLLSVVREASGGKRYVPASSTELQGAERLFLRTMEGKEPLATLARDWRRLRCEMFPLDQVAGSSAAPYWIIREMVDTQCGRGIFAIRPGSAAGTVLQAPHSFYDRHTREIAALLAYHPEIAACAWNTVHRSVVDVAHVDDHYLHAFTRAAANRNENVLIAQLHGFAVEDRETRAARMSDIILSNGTRHPSYWLLQLTAIFRHEFPHGRVSLYPHDVMELGANTNQQAESLRQMGKGRFLSIEMSRALRDRLLADALVRTDFAQTLCNAPKDYSDN